jgi:citrate lyase beta subunit
MKAFFYIKYFENGFKEYFEKTQKSDAIFTFDLEDSIHDFSDQHKSTALKEKYRTILENILNENIDAIQKSSIAIRINHHSTHEFEKDIELLKRLKDAHWQTIILPKTESVNEVQFVLQKLKSAKINFQNISILIESEKGIVALEEIVSANINELHYVHFGHADYNLDRKIFPFKHQDQDDYWRWIERITRELKNTNIIFINSPFLLLNDRDLFNYNLQKLYRLLKEKCGQMTLNLKQTIICNNFKKSDSTDFNCTFTTRIDKFDFAKELIESIESNASNKSFPSLQKITWFVRKKCSWPKYF